MTILFLVFIALGCAVALYNWRWGIWAALLIGLVQDPWRKMILEASGLFAMASVPVWLTALASGFFSGELRPRRFMSTFPRLASWMHIFLAYLILPAILSATYGRGSWQITLLGLVVYGMAFLMLFAGYAYARNHLELDRLLMFYAVVAGLVLVGGPLEYLLGNGAHPALGTVSLGAVWVTHRTGEAVYMMTGFFRGPDVMGWHAAMVFMIATIFALRSRGATRWLWAGLALWAVLSMWICGRRKIISMMPVFAGALAFLVFYYRDARRLLAVVSIVVVLVGMATLTVNALVRDSSVYEYYLTTFSEAGGQLRSHGFDSVLTTLNQAGFWGYGLGMGQQGLHHLQVEKPRLWQESGPTKAAAELGLPGMILFIIMFWFLFRTALSCVKSHARDKDFVLFAGIMAILLANLVAAIVSAQIYTDPFIAMILALLTGLIFGSVRFSMNREDAAP